MKYLMNARQWMMAMAMLATPVLGVTAQGRGGGGGGGMGGGGMGGGFVDMTGMGGGGFGNNVVRPLHYDLDGPFSFDSFTVLLTLDSVKLAKLQQLRTSHLMATAVQRDSVKRMATELGLTSGSMFNLVANTKPDLVKVYDKEIKAVRKLDVAFFEKQVKAELNKEQYNALKNWYGQQRPIGQAARGDGGGRGMGGQGGQGRGGRGGGE